MAENNLEEEFTLKSIQCKQNQHFCDNDIRFEKITKLLEINGGHLSYFNKNLDDVKKTLDEIRTKGDERYEKMRPIIENYESTNNAVSFLKKKGGVLLYLAGAFLTLYAAYNIFQGFIKNYITNLK